MPASTWSRARSSSSPRAPPHTSTRTSVPRSAASSTARRLSASLSRRSASVAAGKKPPRQRLETRSPAARMSAAESGSSLCRHGASQPMPASTQPSTTSAQAELIGGDLVEAEPPGIRAVAGHRLVHARQLEQGPKPARGALGVGQHAGLGRQPEHLPEVDDRPGALHTPEHPEMILMPVQVRDEHDADLVVPGRRGEHPAREGNGWLQQAVVALDVPVIERSQRRRGDRGDWVEDAEQGVAVPVVVAADQLREVEVVAGVQANAGGQPPAERDLEARVQERNLDALDPLRRDRRSGRPPNRARRRGPPPPNSPPAPDRRPRPANEGSRGGAPAPAPTS